MERRFLSGARQSPIAFIMTPFWPRGGPAGYQWFGGRTFRINRCDHHPDEPMTKAAGRILIVDDEPILLKMMNVYLGRLGYTVVTANSTEKAWAEVEAAPHAFAVAVLDATHGAGSRWKTWPRVCWRPIRGCA